MTLLVGSLLTATAYGAGSAVRRLEAGGERPSSAAPSPAPTPGAADPSSRPTPTPEPSPESPREKPEKPAEPEPVLEPGDRGVQVRELQHRLFQIAWFGETTTGRYDPATKDAVSGFQAKRGFRATGVVDRRTWRRLASMTRPPTRDEKFNVLRPGPALFQRGASGEGIRAVQARLKQIAWYFGDVTGTYDAATVESVRGFQAKRRIPVTGDIDQRTMDRLLAMTSEPSRQEMYNVVPKPGALDPRCATGRAMCVDKSTNTLRWVVDGKVLSSFEVRFGSDELPTREGAFSVQRKSRDHVSSLYDTSMPFAMFFSGGQAVHYSPDFAANGYNGASHGCVNVRDYNGIAALFDQVSLGDTVIVYRS
ncbi:murein L,D-transpeptidase [Nocardioides sp. MJB4]|uniref:Murein L,D-transpeptidase n=2 Tax=Nocardioides donggukensis TaxID=2774019 RepID=A0A927KAT9_9ACTN|nr:murein L,D-transpeptidase [Nocardioides donggukensis]